MSRLGSKQYRLIKDSLKWNYFLYEILAMFNQIKIISIIF